ncbi:MAG: efflux RND transporter periplasmic adaptor subunit [Caldilineales bacterium]|nr:efflux RND transporter periplasmic adaptor subunit [Caldilineales bacterium]MDW8317760.1 efflux RND transporter periplasmic adaptor subunit [Anaerolineae bacterium]
MTKKTSLLLPLFLLLVAGGLAACRANLPPPLADLGPAAGAATAAALRATGMVEAEHVTVSSELTGRVVQLLVAEGDTVEAGQALAVLDDRVLRAQAVQADAAVARAQAQLQLVLSGARPEELAHARARVAHAEAAAEAARLGWEDAQRLRDNRQELELKLIEAETAAAAAQHRAAAARLAAEAADLERDLWGRVTELLAQGVEVTLPIGGTVRVDAPAERDRANTQWNLAGQRAWEAWQAAYAAEEAARAAQTALADLRRQAERPIAETAAVHQAEAAYRQALAAVEQARAALQALEEGATAQQIELARQALAQAQAARAALDVPLSKARVTAPASGLISALAVREGEVAAAGRPLLQIVRLDPVTLTVYVPEADLGRVWIGQPVRVTVNSFPGRTFRGTVTAIADRAEFTPKSVQSAQARLSTVFAVEITLPNPDGALKPGMPADALFQEAAP